MPRIHYLASELTARADAALAQLASGVHENPTVGILAANPHRLPHIVKELSRRTYDVAYRHSEDGEPYTHGFGRGVHISLMSDGNVLLWHPTRRLWKKFA